MVSFDICQRNPGCFAFFMAAYDLDAFGAERAFQRMEDFEIKGVHLYMLWNDCCDRNTAQALYVMKRCSREELLTHINYEGGRGIPFAEAELDEYEKRRPNAARKGWWI